MKMIKRLMDKLLRGSFADQKLSQLEEQVRQLQENQAYLSSIQERLSVLEADRDVLFERQDAVRATLQNLTESGLEERVGVLEGDRGTLFTRFDEVQSSVSDRIRVLENDRTVLFERQDAVRATLQNLTGSGLEERVGVLEGDRSTVFARFDDIQSSVSDRILVLENDRTALFDRNDSLQAKLWEIEDVFRSDMRQKAEDIWVQGHMLEKTIANMPYHCDCLKKNNVRVHFIRCLDIYNTGDMNCGPELYFREFEERYFCIYHSIKNIRFDLIRENDWVIVGGGGMLDCSETYQKAINMLLTRSSRVISWGMGHNMHKNGTIYSWEPTFEIEYERFYLFTSRDWGYKDDRYCPCVSCMMPGLEREYKPVRRVGMLMHHEIAIEGFDFDRCDNSQPIDAVLEFIGSSEILITNGYHAAYWATLMGKKVILYQPFSNRFDYFKYPPVVFSGDLEQDIQRAKRYPNALSECRKLNTELRDEIISQIEKELKSKKDKS